MSIKFLNHIVRTFVSSILRKIVLNEKTKLFAMHVKTAFFRNFSLMNCIEKTVRVRWLSFGWKWLLDEIVRSFLKSTIVVPFFMICASNWCFALPSMHEKQCVRQKSTASFINDETRKGSVVHIFCGSSDFKKVIFNIPLYKS